MIIIPTLKLGYQNVPKIATNSWFHWLYGALYGEQYDPRAHNAGSVVNIHLYFRGGRCPDAQKVRNTRSGVSKYQNYFRFAITRDPVKRFLSMYSHLVVDVGELSAKSSASEKLAQAGLTFDPDINDLVRDLDAYFECHPHLFHHGRPMTHFLGPDLSAFSRIADISEMDDVREEIMTFWASEKLDNLVEHAPALEQRQPGRRRQNVVPTMGLEVLTPESFEKLLVFYREDYENIPSVSLSRIRDEYKNRDAVR